MEQDTQKTEQQGEWTTLCTSSGCCPQARFEMNDDGSVRSVEIKDDFGGKVILNAENIACLVGEAGTRGIRKG